MPCSVQRFLNYANAPAEPFPGLALTRGKINYSAPLHDSNISKELRIKMKILIKVGNSPAPPL